MFTLAVKLAQADMLLDDVCSGSALGLLRLLDLRSHLGMHLQTLDLSEVCSVVQLASQTMLWQVQILKINVEVYTISSEQPVLRTPLRPATATILTGTSCNENDATNVMQQT